MTKGFGSSSFVPRGGLNPGSPAVGFPVLLRRAFGLFPVCGFCEMSRNEHSCLRCFVTCVFVFLDQPLGLAAGSYRRAGVLCCPAPLSALGAGL